MRRIFLITLTATMFAACSGASAHHTATSRGSTRPAITEHGVGRRLTAVHLTARHRVHLTSATAPRGDTTPGTSAPTLSSEITSAQNGTVIQLASGSYPQVTDYSSRTGWVTISGQGDATPPQIDGAMLWGAQDVRFVDVDFTGQVYINHNPMPNSTEIANNVQILNSTIDCGSTQTSPLTQGIILRGGSRNIVISGDLIENCVNGFESVAQDALSENVEITNDTFQSLPGDAVDLGGLDNVTISHDIIRDISDPAGVWHNDGIQFFGNDHNVDITDNVLSDSRDQLIFIQDAVAGTVSHDRSNTNILIAGNLIYGAGAVAVQDQGGINVHFLNNTMWDNGLGSLWLLPSPYTRQKPANTAIVNNIIEDFSLFGGATPSIESNNLIVNGPSPSYYALSVDGQATHAYTYGAGDIVGVDPEFVDATDGNFTLGSASPARGAGTTSFPSTLEDPMDPATNVLSTDMFGDPLASPVTIGAFQSSPQTVSFGTTWNTSQHAPQYAATATGSN